MSLTCEFRCLDDGDGELHFRKVYAIEDARELLEEKYKLRIFIQRLVTPRCMCFPRTNCGVWLCPRCLTFRPWCFGCDTEEWPELCDDCWHAIEVDGEDSDAELWRGRDEAMCFEAAT